MSREEYLTQVISTLSDIFEVDASKISEKTNNKNLAKWDSLNHVKLVVALEEEFDLEFDPEEMGGMTSVVEILKVIVSKS
jgi:acyl carrier protein